MAAVLALAGCGGNFFGPRTDTGGGGGGTQASTRTVYIANFNSDSNGNGGTGFITLLTLDTTSGALTSTGTNVSTGSGAASLGPLALVNVSDKFLYSANDGGGISGFSIGSSGALTLLSGFPSLIDTQALPAAIVVTPNTNFMYIADSGSGDVFGFSLNATTGGITPIGPFTTTNAAGPVSLAVHPNGKFLYAALDAQGTDIFSINSDGSLTLFKNVPPLALGTAPQGVAITPSGNFAYIANGTGGVEMYSVNTTTGDLTAISTTPAAAGTSPVVITGDPGGKFVFAGNRDSNNISVYGILSDGSLTQVSGSPFALPQNAASPAAVAVDPSGKFLVVASFSGSTSQGVTVFAIDSNGILTQKSTTAAGNNPAGIAFH